MEIPKIGLGTYGLKDPELIREAIELGYSHLDTAEMYGNEREIGIALKNMPGEVFVTSKVWHSPLTRENILESCKKSLARLGAKHINLYLIHHPHENMDYEEIFSALKELQDGGKIIHIGVSNFGIEEMEKSLEAAKDLGIEIKNNQIEWSFLHYPKEVVDFCHENDISVTAYTPLAKGNVGSNRVISELAKKYDKAPAQICLRWLLHKGAIVIPKSSNPEHMKENLESADFDLEDEDVKKIDENAKIV